MKQKAKEIIKFKDFFFENFLNEQDQPKINLMNQHMCIVKLIILEDSYLSV